MLAIITTILILVLLGFLVSLFSVNRGKTAILIIVIVLFFIIFVLDIVSNILNEKCSKDKTTNIIPIEEISKVSESNYIVRDCNQNIYNIACNDISKGKSNYIIHSFYPNLSEFELFLAGLPKNNYIIIVTDINNITNIRKY